MLKDSKAFSGFSTSDLAKTKEFYGQTLGLDIDEQTEPMGMLRLHLATGGEVIIYPKDNHAPATYTVLNFPVEDIETTVAELSAAGVSFEHYLGTPMQTDDKGIFRGGGPLIAWFTDPGGNILSVIQV
jgi:predicted enzyme related to lactoylglutathione lyase